jgi:hypothetical protein
MKKHTFTAPSNWASALINGDETSFDYYNDKQDYSLYKECIENLIKNFGNASPVNCSEEEFQIKGDYGNLAQNYCVYTILY